MIFFDRFLEEVGIGSFSSVRFENDWFQSHPDSDESLKPVTLTALNRSKLQKNQTVPNVGEAAMVRAMFAHNVQSIWLERFYELVEDAHFYLFEPSPQLNAHQSSTESGKFAAEVPGGTKSDAKSPLESEYSVPGISLTLPYRTCVFEIRGETVYKSAVSFLIHELSAGNFEFFKISRSKLRNRMVAEFNEPEESSHDSLLFLRISELLERLAIECSGIELVEVRAKIGTGENRRRVGTRRLIRVSTLALIRDVIPLGRKPIDWIL